MNVYKRFGKNFSGDAATRVWSESLDTWNKKSAAKSEIMSKQELAEELSKPIIIKFENRKAHSSSKDNLWGADLTLIS